MLTAWRRSAVSKIIKSGGHPLGKGKNMDAETVKAIKVMQEQINDLVRRMDENFARKHNQNSEAIDDIVVSMLGGENNV